MSKRVFIQCGEEDTCRSKNCLKCKKQFALTNTKLTLAEAVSIEDFATVDLKHWLKYKPKQVSLQQDVLRKMMNRIIWEKKGRWRRKICKKIFRFL